MLCATINNSNTVGSQNNKMMDEKADADRVEKAYDDAPVDSDGQPEQDWSEAEERAIVSVSPQSASSTS